MAAPRRIDLRRTEAHAALQEAALVLRRGGLVVLPTETVYGVAAREDRPDAVARLTALKDGRGKPWSHAVADLSTLDSRLAPLPQSAQRLIERWWPGPITLVLPRRDGGRLGVRVPGHAFTRELAAEAGVALLLPSANLPGAPPARSAQELQPQLLELVDLIVDDGPCPLGEASTVVAPAPACLLLLREGVVSRADLLRHARPLVLVVCTGNTCRSPMAAALLEQALARAAQAQPQLLLPAVRSAGLGAGPKSPATPAAVDALAERGLDLSGHASAPVVPEALLAADLVLGLTHGHVHALRELLAAHSEGAGRAPPVELFDPGGQAVEDPFGAPLGVYRKVAAMLERMAAARAAAIVEPTGSVTG